MTSFSLNGYEIAGLVILAYAVIVYLLWRRGWIGRERAVSFFGPALMIRTKHGRDYLDRVGRFRRFWSVAGDLAIVLGAVTMVAMVVLLLIDAVAAFSVSASQAPSVQEALGLPGINPIIPLGYGIVALVVGVALHELFHGFVARSQKIGVKSLGVLWCVVPVGAFVEQDDVDMEGADRRRRDRVAAAGIFANFLIAVVCFLLLSAFVATSVVPNANGVGVISVQSGSPAAAAGLGTGDIIVSVNGTATPNYDALRTALGATHPDQLVNVSYYSGSASQIVTQAIRLAANPTTPTEGFLGIEISGVAPTPAAFAQVLSDPFASNSNPIVGGVYWLLLPFYGLQPVSGGVQNFFHFGGPLAGANPGLAWIGLNLLYWFAWMNFLLGASNALPLIPLDGGLLVRDYVAAIAARVKRSWDATRVNQFAGSFAVASSLVVVLLIIWQFVVPRL